MAVVAAPSVAAVVLMSVAVPAPVVVVEVIMNNWRLLVDGSTVKLPEVRPGVHVATTRDTSVTVLQVQFGIA